MQASRRPLVRATALAALLAIGVSSIAAATEFPPGKEGYHS